MNLPLLLADVAPYAHVVPNPHKTVLLFLLIGVILAIIFNLYTRAGTIARATLKEAIRQPVFILLTVAGVMVNAMNYIVPFFAFDQETKMFIDCGLATTLICTLLLAVWTASMSVAEEIEGKTAMTLLSKPITRRQFIVGKYVGILESVLLMTVIVGTAFFVLTYCKVNYDAKEASKDTTEFYEWTRVWKLNLPMPNPERWRVSVQIIPGLALIFLEAAVLTSVSVAISTRAPMLVNVVACFVVFVIGHLTPVLVMTKLKGQVFVKFVAQLLATLLPALDNCNMQAAISTEKIVPRVYLGQTALYCLFYVMAMILFAFILFEDRDLA